MEKTQQKLINLAVADLYERAMKYSARVFSLTKSSGKRERGVARALAIDACRAYNTVVGLLGPLGSSDICQSKKIVWSKDMVASLELISEEEIEEIINEAFKVTTDERRTAKDAEHARVIDYINKHPQMVATILTGVDTLARKSIKQLDAKKGGIVRHLIYEKGFTPEDARAKAQEILDAEIIQERIKNKEGAAGLSIEQIDNLLGGTSALPVASDELVFTKTNIQNTYLDLLGPDPSSDYNLESNLSVESEVSNDTNDFSSFDDPDDAITVSNTKDKLQNKQEEMGSQLQSSQTSGAEDKQSATQQLLASGTATELAAKELLIKAGIKDRSKK